MGRRDLAPWGRRHGLATRDGFGRQGGPEDALLVRERRTGRVLDLGTPDPFSYVLGPLTLAANGTLRTVSRIVNDSGFLVTSIRAAQSEAASVISVKWTDEVSGRVLQNRMIPLLTCTGNGERPYVLDVPWLHNVNGAIAVELAESAGTGSSVYVHFEGVKLRSGRFGLEELDLMARETPFFYGVQTVIGAGAGVVTNDVIAMHDDGDFELHAVNADDRTDYDIFMRTSSGGYVWSDFPMRASLLMGSGQFPGALVAPLAIAASDTVALQYTNRQAGAQTVNVVLMGAKVWK